MESPASKELKCFGKDTAHILDIVDAVRVDLKSLGNQRFYETTLSDLPQFIVVGAQSAGKSSVLRRISGVKLPESAKLCTRVSTILRIRRGDDEKLQVSLQYPDGHTEDFPVSDKTEVTQAVADAQEAALKDSSGDFAEKHTVDILTQNPGNPNVTLVDLPGFTTQSDTTATQVEKMVERFIDMPGTLILHAVKADQDYDSILGNDFLRRHGNVDRVTVLTHSDRLSGEVGRSRLADTLEKTSVEHSFAVLGNWEGKIEDEAAELEANQCFPDAIIGKLGAVPLSSHIEERMHDHLHRQLPKALASLEDLLGQTENRLEDVQEKSASDILYPVLSGLRGAFLTQKKTFENKLRPILDSVRVEIMNYTLEPLVLQEYHRSFNELDKFDVEELEVGHQIYYKNAKCTIDDIVPGQTVSFMHRGQMCHEQISNLATCAVLPATIDHRDNMVKDITLLCAKELGVRNLVHVDRQPIIEAYMKPFAAFYSAALTNSARAIVKLLSAFFDGIFFGPHVPEVAQPAVKRLSVNMAKRLESLEQDGYNAIDRIKQYNTEPSLVFSPNEHYLNKLIADMTAADSKMATDKGGAMHLFHNVRAFMKVEKKFISEVGIKELVLRLYIEAGREFESVLSTKVSELEAHVREPQHIKTERELLLKRVPVLRSAIEKLKTAL